MTAGRRQASHLSAQRQRLASNSLQQRAVQHRAQRDDRHAAYRKAAVGHVDSAQHTAIGPAHFCGRWCGAGRNDRSCDAQVLQGGYGIGRKQDGEPELTWIRGAFEDADVPPGSFERQPGCETPDAGADDERRTRGRHDADYPPRNSTIGTFKQRYR